MVAPRARLREQALRLLGSGPGSVAAATLGLLLLLQGCGGAGTVSTPAPSPAGTPTPTPTPTPTITPSAAFDTSEYRRSTGPSQENVIAAWSLGANGSGVTLAIIDSGIDTSNPEFAGRISSASADVVSNRGLDNPDSSHGTQVALTAAAARNGTGIMGIAYEATIQMLRADSVGSCATPKVGDSGGCGFPDSAIAAGVDRAVAAGAKVINLSLGGSPASTGLRNAVARAAAAGVVIVVSAGNDGVTSTTNPDVFAVNLRQAGNGNVIIAGSVDTNNAMSSFSNHAGTEAQWYLAARGERVCCVYENGQIKVTTDSSGAQFVTVVSGTSFAAPQIAGAVALVRQYFPNLTAVQAVDLLLRTATDLGTTGTDDLFGRGLLNIGAAFAPQGATGLADSFTTLVPLGDTTLTTSAPMGDAASSTHFDALVLDMYGRAYRVDLGRLTRGGQVPPKLGSVLLGQGRALRSGAGPLSLAFSIAPGFQPAQGGGWAGQLQLSPGDAERARVLAAQVVARLSPQSALGFAYAMGADGIVAQLQGQSRPAFLVSADPAFDFGIARKGLLGTALRQQWGSTGVTTFAESGAMLSGAPFARAGWLGDERRQSRFFRFGAALDRRFGPLAANLSASWLSEERSILGAQLSPGLGGGSGADSLFIDIGAGLDLARNWRLGGSLRQGWTHARQVGRVSSGSAFTSSGWSLDFTRHGLFAGNDNLSLRIAQPLRVSSGGLNLALPVDYSYDTLTATTGLRHINLSPSGHEISRELAWREGPVTASLYWRSDPGHYAKAPDDYGLALGWATEF